MCERCAGSVKEAFSRRDSGVRAACSGRGRREGSVRVALPSCGGVAAALLRNGDGVEWRCRSARAALGRLGSGVKVAWGLRGSGVGAE